MCRTRRDNSLGVLHSIRELLSRCGFVAAVPCGARVFSAHIRAWRPLLRFLLYGVRIITLLFFFISVYSVGGWWDAGRWCAAAPTAVSPRRAASTVAAPLASQLLFTRPPMLGRRGRSWALMKSDSDCADPMNASYAVAVLCGGVLRLHRRVPPSPVLVVSGINCT